MAEIFPWSPVASIINDLLTDIDDPGPENIHDLHDLRPAGPDRR